MRVIVTEAAGIVGRAAVPLLLAAGHTVVGVHRDPPDARWLADRGAIPTTANPVDLTEMRATIAGADAVVNLSASPFSVPIIRTAPARSDHERTTTDRTDRLVDAALGAGVEVFVQESTTLAYRDCGDRWIEEDVETSPWSAATARALAAEAHVARCTSMGRRGVVLRLSQLYGPGDASRDVIHGLRHRTPSVVGSGQNYVSNLHIDDAGAAIVAALDVRAGVYNVSDDRPVASATRLTLQAAGLSVPPPRRIPNVLARATAGRTVIDALTRSHRVSNRSFREVCDWRPRYPSIRDGWATVTASTH